MGSLHPALERTQIALDALPAGAVVIDRYGQAWQCGSIGSHDLGYWYRAYGDDEQMTSWDILSLAPFTLMEPQKKPLVPVRRT